MVKRFLNRAKDLCFLAPFVPIWVRRNKSKAAIFLYHRIEPENRFEFLNAGGNPRTTPEQFRKDIRLLKRLGANFKTVSEIVDNDSDDGFSVAICADDGFRSNYEEGSRICNEEGIPQSIFQCSAMLDSKPLIWEHKLYYVFNSSTHGNAFKDYLLSQGLCVDLDKLRFHTHPSTIIEALEAFCFDKSDLLNEMSALPKKLYPSAEDISVFARSDSEVASHGVNHLPRDQLSVEEFENELKQSRLELEQITGTPISSFSYPFNRYLEQDFELCKQYYQNVFSVEPGFIGISSNRNDNIPRNTFPGHPKNKLRHRRWLLTGRI